MIDIHTHILPAIDDGAAGMDDTLQLLELAAKEQITDIIATPHGHHPNFLTDVALIQERLGVVQQEIQRRSIPVTLHSGMECRLSEKLPERLGSGEALTLAGSKYVLLELPSTGIPAYTVPIIQQLIMANYVPIIAHPERNQAIIEKPERLRKLLLHGAVSQVTAGSVAGHFGKAIQRTALTLIEANYVHLYASDVHSVDKRPFLFNKGLDLMEKKNMHQMVDIFLENNDRIVLDKDILVLEPQDIPKPKWWNVFA